MEPYEILAGPLTIWLSPVGTAFPLIDAEPGAEWKLMGTRGTRNMSNDGVTVQLNQTVNDVIPAGAVGPVKAFRPEERMMFGATLWDCSLEQFTHALGGVDPHPVAAGVGTAGFKALGLSRGQEVKSYAFLARGGSPYGADMIAQFEVPRCYQSGSASPVFNKGVPAGIALQWAALEDLDATSDDERFGRLVAQTAAALEG